MRATGDQVGGACVVVGDFNSTIDMREFRQLAKDGYQDAARQVGAGYLATFPADSPVAPMIGIDHVLLRDCYAESVETIRVPGSDHLGLLASVSVGCAAD